MVPCSSRHDAEYKTSRLTSLGVRQLVHFQIELSPSRARKVLSYIVNRQSRSCQEIVLFSLINFQDIFETMKAQKDKKTKP